MIAAVDDRPPEIVIIRRRLDSGTDAPKGGVWKIAFADFMTAMMAFFLVMWLINASNEETKQAVASYFNPVKLSDVSTKGLRDPQVTAEPGAGKPEVESAAPSSEQSNGAAAAGPENEAVTSEGELFRDPYATLAEIVEGAKPSAAAASGGDKPSGLSGGEAFRDPFDPSFWDTVELAPTINPEAAASDDPPVPDMAQAEIAPAPAHTSPPPAAKAAEVAEPTPPPAAADQKPAEMSPAAIPEPIPIRTAEASAGNLTAEMPPPISRPGAAAPPASGPLAMSQSDSSLLLQEQLTEALQEAALGPDAPDIEIRDTGEGVLISLTDDIDFGMFEVGSAEPQPEVIALMEKIAGILNSRPGEIVIRGHTDARPFKSDTYDNWRLSTARAHMAYYMLVRGGLDEKRIGRVEGYADRMLKLPDDPESARNRRIEILVREAAPT